MLTELEPRRRHTAVDPVALIQDSEEKVGPAFHLLEGPLYESHQFIRRYHDPAIRAQVQARLAEFAAEGATRIQTRIWSIAPAAENTTTWGSFPPSAQEIINLAQYAADVVATPTPSGRRLELWVVLLWLHCSAYTISVGGTFGACGYTWAQLTGLVAQTYTAVATVPNIARVDLEGEVAITASPNQEQFLIDLWPGFRTTMLAAGIMPGVYYIAGQGETIFDPWTDPLYRVLDGHGSMFYVYRSHKFFTDNGMVPPTRVDFSGYVAPLAPLVSHTVAEWQARVLADAVAVFPGVGVGLAETFYPLDPAHARSQAKAFGVLGQSVHVCTWPASMEGGASVYLGPPYTWQSYFVPRYRQWWRGR